MLNLHHSKFASFYQNDVSNELNLCTLNYLITEGV